MRKKLFLCLDVLVHRDPVASALKREAQTGRGRVRGVCDDVPVRFFTLEMYKS